MSLSTHILDTALGRPASGIEVRLERMGETWKPLHTTRSDADGRARDFPTALPPGSYRLRFETAPYFAAQGLTPLHPWIEIAFTVSQPGTHLHIPLLVTANGFTTYRGS